LHAAIRDGSRHRSLDPRAPASPFTNNFSKRLPNGSPPRRGKSRETVVYMLRRGI